MISECIKQAQKEYKTRHDWVENVINLELCNKFKFDHTAKWYKHKPESVLENETNKIPQGFWSTNRFLDYLIPARRPHLAILN